MAAFTSASGWMASTSSSAAASVVEAADLEGRFLFLLGLEPSRRGGFDMADMVCFASR